MPSSAKDSLRLLFVVAVAATGALTASGCVATAGPVVRLQPDTADFVWISGRAVVFRDVGGLRLAVAFDHLQDDLIGMRVEVQNNNDQRVEVDPAQFRYVYCADEKRCSRPYAVIDPEQKLLELDQARSQVAAQASLDATVGGALLFLSLVGDVATVASGKGHRSTGAHTAAVAASTSADLAYAESAMTNIGADNQAWSAAALRRTTLFPGQGVSGYVYVGAIPEKREMWLGIPVGDALSWFHFRQTAIEPKRAAPSREAQECSNYLGSGPEHPGQGRECASNRRRYLLE